MLLFMNVPSFTSPLSHFYYILTVLLLSSFSKNTFVFKSLYIITIIIAEWFIKIAATATTYYTGTFMTLYASVLWWSHGHKKRKWCFRLSSNQINLSVSYDYDGVYAETERNKVWLKNMYKECIVSLNFFRRLTEQTQTYLKSTYKLI